jgi:thiol-disulfide isomerase/thioredoxin
MRILNLIVIFCIFFPKLVHGENETIICGKIKSVDKFIVNFYEPIHGYYNIAFLDTNVNNRSLINGIDSIHKIIDIDQPSFITIYFTNEKKEFISRSDVLMFPGDSLHLNIDLTKDDLNSFVYSGDNSIGQKLFNEINFQPFNKFIPVFDILDKLPNDKNSFVKEVENIPLAIKARFDSLQKKSLITKAFNEYMNLCFKSLIYDQVVLSLLRQTSKYNVIIRKEMDSIISILYLDQAPSDKRLKGLYGSFFYLYDYYNFLTYKKYNLKSITELTTKAITHQINNHKYLIREDFVPFIYISNESDKKNLWALYLLIWFNNPGKYGIAAVKQYDSIFPNNNWSQLLRKKFSNSGIPTRIEYNFQSPVQFIDTTKTNSLNDVLTQLPENKAVFIDIWASWCAPCISAFGFNQNLDTFLINKNIQRLYISLDGTENYKKWNSSIKKYALGGYHVLANDFLKNELKRIIYNETGNQGMGIPRYVLIQNGKIIIDDAISPTEFDLLRKQILDVLKQE